MLCLFLGKVQLNQCGPHNQGFVCVSVCVCVYCVCVCETNTHTHNHGKTLGYEDHIGLTGH